MNNAYTHTVSNINGTHNIIIDEQFAYLIDQYTWFVGCITPKYKNITVRHYLMRTKSRKIQDTSPTTIYLHKQIMELVYGPAPDNYMVDHKNGNSLDCRLENMRYVPVSVNNSNRESTSKYVGVLFSNTWNKYFVRKTDKYPSKWTKNEIEAAMYYATINGHTELQVRQIMA